VIEHSSFLKRNGSTVASILEASLPPIETKLLSLLEELSILVGTDAMSPFLDGRSRRAWLLMLKTHPPQARVLWSADQWDQRVGHLQDTVPSAGRRLRTMYQLLSIRPDFPDLGAMRKWGHPRWRSFFRGIGTSPALSGMVTSLALNRRELPSGPRTTQVYKRLGYACGREGRPSVSGAVGGDIAIPKWRLQHLAITRCTPEIDPGGKACKACPLGKFCRANREARNTTRNRSLTMVDLFAGPGGMSLGMTRAGMRLLLAVEKDRHAVDTLYLNHAEQVNGVVLNRDVRTIFRRPDLLERVKDVDVLVGGPPCQAWSIVRRHSRADTNHPTRHLVREFVRAARVISPKIAVLENVPGLRNASNGNAFSRTLRAFKRAGFVVDYLELNAADYGVPQNRRRIFFFAVKRKKVRNPEELLDRILSKVRKSARHKHRATVEDAISGLPRIMAGEGAIAMRNARRGPRSKYAGMLTRADPLVHNHQARPHNARDLAIFQGLRWGEVAWQYEKRRPGSIPYQLDSFSDKYRKLHPKRQSPTIPSHLRRDANSYVHPLEARGITPREAARIQSFPDDYVFLGGFGPSFIQIGNAVPPILAESIGRAILKNLH